MTKTILITGATDGIGKETARRLAVAGHNLLLHGRNEAKLTAVAEEVGRLPGAGRIEIYRADLSRLAEVRSLAEEVSGRHDEIDVLINNAGVLRATPEITDDGLDVRFAVNTLAPALLTRCLLPVMPAGGRIVHLSSAAQAPVDLEALAGRRTLEPMVAYSQSKLALTMWSQALAAELGPRGPTSVAVNPGSLLGTNMVRDGFGIPGDDIGIGADILIRAALSDAFGSASGHYYDNDHAAFAAPHRDASDPAKVAAVVRGIEAQIADHLGDRAVTAAG